MLFHQLVYAEATRCVNADHEILTRLQQELNTQFLQDRGLLALPLSLPANSAVTVTPAPFSYHAEMHQHQQLHYHHQQQRHLLNRATTPSLDPVSRLTV